MRIGSAFLKARDDKEDRIQKRRSDNMAAFNSYVKTQSELGVDASVQDLEQMKQNLAGGDFYYGKQLPSSNVIKETSARLGAIQADKDANFASTRLSNESKSIANMKDILPFYLGTDPNTEKGKTALRDSKPFASLIGKFGEQQAFNFLNLQNEGRISEYIANRNLGQFVTKEGIDVAVGVAPTWMQTRLRGTMEANMRAYYRKSHDTAIAEIAKQHTSIFKLQNNKVDAVKAAVELYTRSLPYDVPVDPTVLDRVSKSAAADWVLYTSDNMSRARLAARSLAPNSDLYSNKEALNAEVLKVLAENNIDPEEITSNEIASIRRIILSNSQSQLVTEENTAVDALIAKIQAAPKRDYDFLNNPKQIEEYAIEQMGGLGFDLTRARWTGTVDGSRITAKDLLLSRIKRALGGKAYRDNILEREEDVDNFEIALRATVDERGEPTILAGYLNSPVDNSTKEKVFNEVNRLRAENDLKPYPSMNENDPNNKDWANDWDWFSNQIGQKRVAQYTAEFNAVTKTAATLVEENQQAVEARLLALASAAGGEDSVAYQALNALNATFGIPSSKIDSIVTMMSEHITGKNIDPKNDVDEFNRAVMALGSNLGLTPKETYRQQFTTNFINAAMDAKDLVKPGQSVEMYATEKVNLFKELAMPHVLALQNLSPDADPEKIKEAKAALQVMIDAVDDQRKVIRTDLESPQIYGVLNMSDHQQGLAAMRVQLDEFTALMRSAKPSKEPVFLIWNAGKGGYIVNDSAEDDLANARKAGYQLEGVYVRDESSPTGFTLKNPEEIKGTATVQSTETAGVGTMPTYNKLSVKGKQIWEYQRGGQLVGTTSDAILFDAIAGDDDGAAWISNVSNRWLNTFRSGRYSGYVAPTTHGNYTRKAEGEPRTIEDLLNEVVAGHIHLGSGTRSRNAKVLFKELLERKASRDAAQSDTTNNY